MPRTNKIPDMLSRWVDAINSNDLASATALYSPKAILIPSMSGQLKKDAVQIREYIGHLLSKKDFNVEVIEAISQSLDEIKVDSGIYIFSWSEGKKRQRLSARFTFVIHNGLIIQHHSSVTPAVD